MSNLIIPFPITQNTTVNASGTSYHMINNIILQTALIFPETPSEKRLQHSIKIGAITIDYYDEKLSTYMQQFSRC